jgi:transcriptional regulator with XRE-family HTH domain
MDNVATRRHTPTVRLRRLAAELRRLRASAELSRETVSEQTGINGATLYRIETARTRPQMRTLTALIKLYGVEPAQRDYLTALCRDAATQGWLRPHHSDLPEEYTAYISFEDEASSVSNYESLFIPGLLQTEDYAASVIQGVLPTATPTEVEDRVTARIERQQVLTRSEPLKLWAIVDEAALRRMVGGEAVMKRQLTALNEAMTTPNVTLQVIRFGVGAHPGMPGSFVLMKFVDPMDTDLIYIDSMAGDLFLESDADVRRYTAIFDVLRAVALSPGDSATLIAQLRRDIE